MDAGGLDVGVAATPVPDELTVLELSLAAPLCPLDTVTSYPRPFSPPSAAHAPPHTSASPSGAQVAHEQEADVEGWLRRKFEGMVRSAEIVMREDLDLVRGEEG